MKQLAGRQQRPKYRLSPNEVEQLKKEETERRRRLRIVQVREQSKAAAAVIRHNVKHERNRQLVKLAHQIQNELEAEKQEEVRKLEQQYDNTLRTVGQGHTQAMVTDKKISNAEKEIRAYQNQQRADERHKEALRKVALDKAYKEYEDSKSFRDRQAALEEERKRAAEVAARPPPPPDAIADAVLRKQKQKKAVPLTDMNAFSSTHYHIPDFAVERAPTEQQLDGKAAGDEEDQRTKEEISERRKKEHDQLIRARIRGNEALKKEILKHDYDALMADLSLQQRADRRQRQVVVSKLPKQVFLPPDRRMEELADKQMEMERAFEDMYMKQMNLSGDLSLTLDPDPLPATPADDSLEATDNMMSAIPAINPALRELTNISRIQGQPVQQGKPETVLKKLLSKIKEQRNEAEADRNQATVGQENLEFRPQKTDMADTETDFTTARQPVKKPAADPDLDLSPLKAAGNQKPPKHPETNPDEDLGEAAAASDREALFLDQLQGRLQAIEAQKEYLDKVMRERQQQFLNSRHASDHWAAQRPEYAPAASADPQTAALEPSGWSHPGGQQQQQAPVFQPQGPAGDTAGLPNKPVFGQGHAVLGQQPHGVSSTVPNLSQSLGASSLTSASLDTARRLGPQSSHVLSNVSTGLGYSNLSTHVGELSAFSGLSGMMSSTAQSSVPVHSQQRDTVGQVSMAGMRGIGQSDSFVPPQWSGVQSVAGPMPPTSSLATQPSFPATSMAAAAVGGMQTLPVTGGSLFHTQQPPSVGSQMYGREFPLSSTSGQYVPGMSNTGNGQYTFQSTAAEGGLGQSAGFNAPPTDFSSLASRLASGLSEEERLQHLRNYQQQLINKHQERMRALQDTRASIETRQTRTTADALSSSLSASQRCADPQSLVPYTLKTSVLQPEPSSASGLASASFALPAAMAVPLSSASGSFATVSSAMSSQASDRHSAEGSARLPSTRDAGHVPSGATGPSSYAGESADVLSAMEPILAGSSRLIETGQLKRASPQQAMHPPALNDAGDMLTSRTSNSSKLDSVRKSLPFDSLENTPNREKADMDGNSMADDSYLSSSTERGSPALGSHSNKSSISGSGLSGMSNGSLGGSSLVARAEEKRESFEQRQRELQDQLAEIQRQKDALLQRYHGNQQRVSAQEETLRSKLKTAKASTSLLFDAPAPKASSSSPPSMTYQPVTALALGVHQSASPSMDLEEGSLCSDRLSAAKSWATELEEYSLSRDKSGEGGEGPYKSPSSMTLEEFSITSDRSGGGGGTSSREPVRLTERLAPETRPTSNVSSLEEYSIASGSVRHSWQVEGTSLPLVQSARGSETSASVSRTPVDTVRSKDECHSGRGRLEIGDLLHEGGGVSEGGIAGGITWSEVLSSGQSQNNTGDSDMTRYPPPPSLQPTALTDYKPHELSTILEVDTPQTGTKHSSVSRTSPPAGGGEAGPDNKVAARRHINFNRQGATAEEDKFSASGSSASSDVRSVIEVRPGRLKSAGTASTTGSAGDSSFSLRGGETRFRENILESSSMKGVTGPSHSSLIQDSQPVPSQEVSYASSGQGFQSLELTLDSLTPRSTYAEDPQGQGSIQETGDPQDPVRGRIEGEHVDDVLRQARQFNQDLMTAIHRQSADVFDQSSLSSLSRTGADNSQA